MLCDDFVPISLNRFVSKSMTKWRTDHIQQSMELFLSFIWPCFSPLRVTFRVTAYFAFLKGKLPYIKRGKVKLCAINVEK